MINTHFRFASKKDTALILDFIKDLAEYENLSNEVVADKKTLEKWLFKESKAEVVFPPLEVGLCN